jgi:hypothetical protein
MRFTFVGCSFTVGEGLDHEKDDQNNYANIVSKKYGAVITNLSKRGNSNHNIFMLALNELLFNPPDILFVQWSGLNRLWVYPGPDSELFLSHKITHDYNYRDLFYSKKDLQKLSDMYHILNHDYNNLLTLINYCNILVKINNCRVVFINGLVPWTEEILNENTATNFSENLSEYLKDILEFKSRDDTELLDFFNKLNIAASGLNQNQWVNMFNSMVQLKIDVSNDNMHPGPKSHQQYADMIINYLEKSQ